MKATRGVLTVLITLAVLTIAAVPARAQDPAEPTNAAPGESDRFGEIHLWIGQLSPSAKSDFWDDNFRNFTARRSRLDGPIFGGDYLYHLDRHNAVMFSGSLYVNTVSEPARTVQDENGNPLEHHLELAVGSLGASYVLFPAGSDHPVIPYLGAGAGLYFGELQTFRQEFTTTSDTCDDPDSSCTDTNFVDGKSAFLATLGYFFVAGLQVPVSDHVAVDVEGRYTVAKANVGGDFSGNSELDLSGGQIAAGVAFRF